MAKRSSLKHVIPALSFLVACFSGVGLAASKAPQVVLGNSHIVGQFASTEPEVAEFLGLRYAQAPLGEWRWQPPRPAVLPEGQVPATAFGAACVQSDYNAQWYADVAQHFGFHGQPVRTPPVSEDCLFLNIWSPDTRAQAPKPVMVWIHGGSNKAGWGFEPNYLGHTLAAAEDVVVVSINYRLGVFGFFDFPGRQGATNFALLDQIAALQWLQKHIRAFGGDPKNVTLFGESAGAANIGYLMTSPVAGHLFHRAISQSGGFQLREWRNQGSLADMGRQLAQALPGQPGDLAALKAQTADALLTVQENQLKEFYFRAQAGQPELPLSSGAFFRSQTVPVDLLIGTNANEWYMYNQDDDQAVARALATLPQALRAPLQQRLAGLTDNRHAQDQLAMLTDMICPAYFMAAQTQLSQRQAWVYRFERVREGPGGAALLAYHGAEIPYVFNSHDHWLTSTDADATLSRAMMRYWANFARTGNPNDADLPAWPAYRAAAPQILRLDSKLRASAASDTELCRTMNPILWH